MLQVGMEMYCYCYYNRIFLLSMFQCFYKRIPRALPGLSLASVLIFFLPPSSGLLSISVL